MQLVKDSGESLTLRIRSIDGLWALATMLRKGQRIGMLGARRDTTTGRSVTEDGRSKAAERRSMRIELAVEQVEHQPFSDRLRVHGTITDAPIDLGAHHTHLISIGDKLDVYDMEMWTPDDRALLKSTIAVASSGRIIVVVVEADEITTHLLSMSGWKELDHKTLRGGGKRASNADSVLSGFIHSAASALIQTLTPDSDLHLLGPGSSKQALDLELSSLGHRGKRVLVPTNSGGRSALHEFLSGSTGNQAITEHALAKATTLMDESLRRIATNGAVVYGMDAIQQAAEEGAIETLLIDAEHLRSGTDTSELSDLVRATGGDIVQCPSHHDASEELLGLGGCIALLRWKIEP